MTKSKEGVGVVPDRLRQSLCVPGAELLPTQDDHHIVVFKLTGPSDVSEVRDIDAGVLAAHRQSPIGALASEGATDPLVGHHQGPPFLGHLCDELGDLCEPCRWPPLCPIVPRRRLLHKAVAVEGEIPDLDHVGVPLHPDLGHSPQ